MLGEQGRQGEASPSQPREDVETGCAIHRARDGQVVRRGRAQTGAAVQSRRARLAELGRKRRTSPSQPIEIVGVVVRAAVTTLVVPVVGGAEKNASHPHGKGVAAPRRRPTAEAYVVSPGDLAAPGPDWKTES